MNLTLITGLDGAGKTTLLKKIREKANFNEEQIINLPQINLNTLKDKPELYHVAEFINKLSKVGDVLQMPQLKAVSLFASMLLFKEILLNLKTKGFEKVYCERHPLIDTSIYAKFYAEKLHPKTIDNNFLTKLDEKNADELNYLINLLPKSYIDKSKGLTENIMNFIFQWFHKEKKYKVEDLKYLYKVELPDKIYFLKAHPEFLFNRIKERKLLEAHETIKALTMMGEEYEKFFNKILRNNNGLVEFVNIETGIDFEMFLKKMIKE